MPACHHGGVAGHAAARGQDRFGGMHAVDVFRTCLDTNENGLAPFRFQLFGIFR